jgi:hypothetical protein
MVDEACGYNSEPVEAFTPEQDAILRTLSEQNPIQFAIGTSAAIAYVKFFKTPDKELTSELVKFMEGFMSDEPLDEDALE